MLQAIQKVPELDGSAIQAAVQMDLPVNRCTVDAVRGRAAEWGGLHGTQDLSSERTAAGGGKSDRRAGTFNRRGERRHPT